MTSTIEYRDPGNYTRIFRDKYAQDDTWIKEFLLKAQIGHIATRWETQPFLTPLLFWYSEEKHTIYVHTNLYGRLQANCEQYPEACFEACEMGRLLPSNVALEFGMQYASVVAFGKVRRVQDDEEKRFGLQGLLDKYFPDLKAGVDYRPILQEELDQTGVFAFEIESWSGKKNWKDSAKQSTDWKPLDTSILERYGE
jgi:nitroimidazol reductase NimA-like FMN-containing flavoprotein (pyridoxamine 5'-phosphate oxidase superfamily)